MCRATTATRETPRTPRRPPQYLWGDGGLVAATAFRHNIGASAPPPVAERRPPKGVLTTALVPPPTCPGSMRAGDEIRKTAESQPQQQYLGYENRRTLTTAAHLLRTSTAANRTQTAAAGLPFQLPTAAMTAVVTGKRQSTKRHQCHSNIVGEVSQHQPRCGDTCGRRATWLPFNSDKWFALVFPGASASPRVWPDLPTVTHHVTMIFVGRQGLLSQMFCE